MDEIIWAISGLIIGLFIGIYLTVITVKGPFDGVTKLLADLEAKGVRARTMMIKAKTDCACAHPEKFTAIGMHQEQ